MTDRSGLMRDYDWVEPSGFPKVPFSYTGSDAEAITAVWERGARKGSGVR